MRRSFFAPFRSTRFVVACVITVVAFCILINLGLWQLSRSQEKIQIEQQVNHRANLPPTDLFELTNEQLSHPTGVRVQLEVKPVEGRYLLLDNQSFDGSVGYLALQLVQTQTGKKLLLERGFIEAPSLRSELPVVDWLSASVEFEGRLYRKSVNPLSRDLHIEPGEVSRIQNLNFAQLEQAWQVEIEPYVVQPLVEPWPYIQPWQPVSMNSEKHIGYAMQWFSMAAVLAVISLALLIRIFNQGGSDE